MPRTALRMLSPSEQVDHVWHMHQTFTAQYRNDCFNLFGRLFKHLPALGGQEDGDKFNDIYKDTLEYYEAMFGYKPREDLWEPPEIRFSSELFSYSIVNLSRLATLSLYMAYNKQTELKHSKALLDRAEISD